VNIALLCTLQARPDAYFWPESLARSLRVSPARLLREIRELEEFGFGIEHQPHRGVRYTEPAWRLCVEQIEWELETRTIGRRISVWRRTTSTNDLAARAATTPSNDGLVVLAEEQTAGRGRRHRRWFAPPHSSILMSVLVFPPESVRSVMLLTSLAAVAVADLLIESLGLPALIKWPNDVRVSGKKVCGILVEGIIRKRTLREPRPATKPRRAGVAPAGSTERDTRRSAVIGVGINVNVPQSAFPAQLDGPVTSLMELCGRRLDRSDLIRRLVQRLDQLYQLALTGSAEVIWKRWYELADMVGQIVQVDRVGDRLRGRLIAIRPPEALSLQLASGRLVELAVNQVLSISEAAAD
jgi:BirA family biotin operon repressor/biotin-[acetyl-CoA-carboxylase] ligase